MTTRNLAAWHRNPATGKLQWDFDINDYLTITGSGFGTKSESVYYDDFESRTVGAVSGSVGSINWSISAGSSVSTANPHSGTKGIQHNYASNDFPKAYKQLSNANRVYMSCYLYFSGTIAAGSVWKMGRVGSNGGVSPQVYNGSPHVGASYTSTGTVNHPVSYGGEIVTGSASSITSSAANMSGYNTTPTAAFVPDSWLFYEIEFYTGTIDGSNCLFEERVNGGIVSRWINRPFLTTDNSNLLDWILLPINGLDNSPPIVYSLDELYITESRNRIVMTDTSNPAIATKRSLQEDLEGGWSDSLIYYLPKRGNFTQGDTAYLQIYNDGVLVDTKTIVVP